VVAVDGTALCYTFPITAPIPLRVPDAVR